MQEPVKIFQQPTQPDTSCLPVIDENQPQSLPGTAAAARSSTLPATVTAATQLPQNQPQSLTISTAAGGSSGIGISLPPLLEPSLPFVDEDFFMDSAESRPAEPLLKTSTLPEIALHISDDLIFKDRILPQSQHVPVPNLNYTVDYFVALSTMASSQGHSWPAGTPNYCGARIKLAHSSLNIPRWRHHLVG